MMPGTVTSSGVYGPTFIFLNVAAFFHEISKMNHTKSSIEGI